MKTGILVMLVSAFVLGWSLGDVFDRLGAAEQLNIPFSTQRFTELSSPQDFIKEDNIHVYSNRVVIDLKDPEWARFADTNSMDPVFDAGANAIQIVPSSKSEIQAGDIISFSSKFEDGTIIHRVVEIGSDEDGWYALTKGDNNQFRDPGRVRFKDIKKVLVAIIY